MARINVDDDVESRPEYRRLLKIVGYDDDKALGMLVRFWRVAQKHWGEHELVPMAEIVNWDFQPIIESRWGVPRENGIYAIGSETRFAWYRQKCDAGRAGGRPKGGALLENRMNGPQPGDSCLENHAHSAITDPHVLNGKAGETGGNRDEPDANRVEPYALPRFDSVNPLVPVPVPAPVPVPVPVKKQTRNTNTNTLVGIRTEYPTAFESAWKQYGMRGDKKEAFTEWGKLGLQPGEMENLGKAIARYVNENPNPQYRKHFGRFLKSDWRPYVDTQLSIGNGIYTPKHKNQVIAEQNDQLIARLIAERGGPR